jgi:hypothetical protein
VCSGNRRPLQTGPSNCCTAEQFLGHGDRADVQQFGILYESPAFACRCNEVTHMCGVSEQQRRFGVSRRLRCFPHKFAVSNHYPAIVAACVISLVGNGHIRVSKFQPGPCGQNRHDANTSIQEMPAPAANRRLNRSLYSPAVTPSPREKVRRIASASRTRSGRRSPSDPCRSCRSSAGRLLLAFDPRTGQYSCWFAQADPREMSGAHSDSVSQLFHRKILAQMLNHPDLQFAQWL